MNVQRTTSVLIALAVILFTGTALSLSFLNHVNLNAADVEAASAVESVEALAPAADAAVDVEVVTLCRAAADGWTTLCFRSDGSGTMTVENGSFAAEYRYAFYAEAGACPAAPAGFETRMRDWATSDWLQWGFTADELASLGLADRYCAYAVQ